MSGEGTAPQSVPAGWYPDPADPAGKRWWDGARWTNDVQAAPSAPQAPAASPVTTFGARPTLTRGAIVPDAFEARHDYARATQETGIAHTRSGWWLSGQPLWSVVPQVVIVALIQSLIPQQWLPIVLAVLAFNLVVLGILVALAHADRAALLAGGNETAAAPWWVLLTPFVYLILRAREISHYEVGGWSGVIWWIVAAVITPLVALLAYYGAIGLAL